jgi:hypothetical protein
VDEAAAITSREVRSIDNGVLAVGQRPEARGFGPGEYCGVFGGRVSWGRRESAPDGITFDLDRREGAAESARKRRLACARRPGEDNERRCCARIAVCHAVCYVDRVHMYRQRKTEDKVC